MVLLTNFHWAPIALLAIGIPWLIFVGRKLKEVHFLDNSIYIKDGDQFEEVNISNIDGNVERTQYLHGSYKIRFKDPTKFGEFILFLRRKNI